MRGTVKFYNTQKGYGFIYSEGSEDFYFHINDWKDSSVPLAGDIVEFILKPHQKGDRACQISIVSKAQFQQKSDDRIACPSCGKKVVPRVVMYHGEVDKTVCPFCTATIVKVDRGFCYIATAVYGSYEHPKVLLLRAFRDQKLLTNNAGKLAVKLYYLLSPYLIKSVSKSQAINKFMRFIIDRIILKIT